MLKYEIVLDLLRSNRGKRFTAQEAADEANADRTHVHRVYLWAISQQGDVKRDTTSRPYEYWVD